MPVSNVKVIIETEDDEHGIKTEYELKDVDVPPKELRHMSQEFLDVIRAIEHDAGDWEDFVLSCGYKPPRPIPKDAFVKYPKEEEEKE